MSFELPLELGDLGVHGRDAIVRRLLPLRRVLDDVTQVDVDGGQRRLDDANDEVRVVGGQPAKQGDSLRDPVTAPLGHDLWLWASDIRRHLLLPLRLLRKDRHEAPFSTLDGAKSSPLALTYQRDERYSCDTLTSALARSARISLSAFLPMSLSVSSQRLR